MSKSLGEMEYTDDSMLLSGGVYPETEADNPIEIDILDKTRPEDENVIDALSDWTDHELEAKIAAKKNSGINEGIYS